MTFTLKRVLAMFGLAAMLVAVSASQAQNRDQSLRGKLAAAIEVASQNQLEIVSVKATALSTIYEVQLNTGEILYADISGDYLFAGDMYRTSDTGLINLSTGQRQQRSLAKVAAIPAEEMIIFTPDEIKTSITVFTDVDCTYCRKLHSELDSLMAKGIEVRYMAYPRGGVDADSFEKMVSVWCADDRKKALTQAKNGQNLPEADCNTPIMEHYALGNELGISGTPALVFPDGRVIPGYLDSDRLAAMLKID
ncbi:DsbC family protein [Gammaproteobacteria bacterium]|jgi:thiol:disulfide interchange protein DsbC|nr:DsbC family protein [Gammaproteobacteria bacterium]MBT6483000.1 DsbC family protein [Gammaproteobacteria bacterium]MBT7226239.1 DsbC family protein [Gammaproteobacteria bacterium]MDB3898046.1 DsbC family protein [Gammaproteobacteria bacterium]MDB3909801.1 DsbC family protein [Gammaproteobacteria bacterium]